MTVYKCGNYSKDESKHHDTDDDFSPPPECPLCGAEKRDEPPGTYQTVSVTCPGWYDE